MDSMLDGMTEALMRDRVYGLTTSHAALAILGVLAASAGALGLIWAALGFVLR